MRLLPIDATPASAEVAHGSAAQTSARVGGLASAGFRMFLDPNAVAGGATAGAAAAAATAAPAGTQASPPVPGSAAGAGDLGTILQSVMQRELGPLRQDLANVQAQVQQMRTPQAPTPAAGAAPGAGAGLPAAGASATQGAPGQGGPLNPQSGQGGFNIRTGESVLSSRGYQISRVMAVQAGMMAREHAKAELEMNGRLREIYGNTQTQHGNSILIPFASTHIQGFDPAIAIECRQMMGAGVAGADMGRMNLMVQSMAARQAAGGVSGHWTQSLASWDETSLGAFYTALLQGEVIDLLRSRLVFTAAGAREITMPQNGKLPMGRILGSIDAKWIGQDQTNRTISESSPKFGGFTMFCKKLGVIVTAPNDLLRFGSSAFEAFIRQDVATSMAHKEEEAFIKGIGGLEPRGLLNYPGINTYTAGITGTDGNTFMPSDFDFMTAALEELDLDASEITFIMRPLLRARMKSIRVDAVTAADGKGVYLSPQEMERRTDGGSFVTTQGYRTLKSSVIPKNRTKGSSSVLTLVLAGIFSEFIIGRHGVMEVASSDSAGTSFENDLSKWRFIEYVDGGPRREEAFVVCDQLVGGYT